MQNPAERAVVHTAGKSPADLEELAAGIGKVDLAPFGVTVASSPDDSAPRFDRHVFLDRLRTSRIGRKLVVARSMASTQLFVHENSAALPSGTICVTDIQTSGKGRGSNTWSSPEGCLMFSFTTRVKDGRTLPLLQYVVTLAIVEAVQAQAALALGPAAAQEAAAALAAGAGRAPAAVAAQPLALVDVRIKWPNDVYSGGKKIGGVLCQSTYVDGDYAVTVGIGLNVSNSEPSTCVNDIVAAAAAAGASAAGDAAPARIGPEALLAEILGRYEALEAVFVAGGFAPLQTAYLYHWLHSRQRVTLIEGEGEARQEVPLTIGGLTPAGYLLAVDGLGAEYELHPDGNSLDFFQGLVRKKLP